MKKILLMAVILVISVISFSITTKGELLNTGNYFLQNEKFTVVIGGIDSEQPGFIKNFRANASEKDLFNNHNYFISKNDLEITKIENVKEGIKVISKNSTYYTETVYYMTDSDLWIKTKIKNISNKSQLLKFTETIDYQKEMPYYTSSRINDDLIFMMQNGVYAIGYFPETTGDIKKLVINNNRLFSSPAYKKINPMEEFTFTRFIRVEKNIADIQKFYYEKNKITYDTYKGKISLNTGKKAGLLPVYLRENEIGTLISFGFTDENGIINFYTDKNEYFTQVEIGELKSDKVALKKFFEIDLNLSENRFLYQPYLTNQTKDGITINFKTEFPAKSQLNIYSNNKKIKTYEINTPNLINHVEVKDLEPNQEYNYIVNIKDTFTKNEIFSAIKTFKTKPSIISNYTFIVYGDTQIFDKRHEYVVNSIVNSGINPEFIVKPGDNVEKGHDEKMWQGFFKAANPLISKIPYYTALGNHEYNDLLYYKAFSHPEGGGDYKNQWYSFDYGNSHFIILDSNVVETNPKFKEQLSWLENDLKTNKNKDFIFVAYHHPFWTTGTEYGPMEENLPEGHYNRKYWEPLFIKYGVDAVFNGHLHAYERHYKDNIMYITSGGGGAKLNQKHNAKPLDWHVMHELKKLNFVEVNVYQDRIDFTVYAVGKVEDPLYPYEITPINEIIDKFSIKK
ncbi:MULTISPECIES: purple acid phosphatase family protein [Oceanotoga]|jgi:hypothetical protein|uniref:purple acid phosphatase family protein n=1 Tax=Oceanotoga TaxID=1255275 RepID=UPI00265211B0|nr:MULTISPECIES: metallophosphoesterase family protein [Oceanotoga]MDN5342979.1 acid phosphatase type 7 [Oceanotoga sp.]MDO7976167.1 metallophosphoesterase family protein [Oceanotoga teriensis]